MRTAYEHTQHELYTQGVAVSHSFLTVNGLKVTNHECGPLPTARPPKGSYGCGHYLSRQHLVWVNPDACARPGKGMRAWSFPGYKVDRTPVGVVAHETGHALDNLLSYPSNSSEWLKLLIKYPKEAISSYEPNASEAFAETARLFITNPALLRAHAPMRYRFFVEHMRVRTRLAAPSDPLHTLQRLGAAEPVINAAKRIVQRASKNHV